MQTETFPTIKEVSNLEQPFKSFLCDIHTDKKKYNFLCFGSQLKKEGKKKEKSLNLLKFNN